MLRNGCACVLPFNRSCLSGIFDGMFAVAGDLMKLVSGTVATAYGSVFLFEAAIFLVSATMALKIMSERSISPEMVPGE